MASEAISSNAAPSFFAISNRISRFGTLSRKKSLHVGLPLRGGSRAVVLVLLDDLLAVLAGEWFAGEEPTEVREVPMDNDLLIQSHGPHGLDHSPVDALVGGDHRHGSNEITMVLSESQHLLRGEIDHDKLIPGRAQLRHGAVSLAHGARAGQRARGGEGLARGWKIRSDCGGVLGQSHLVRLVLIPHRLRRRRRVVLVLVPLVPERLLVAEHPVELEARQEARVQFSAELAWIDLWYASTGLSFLFLPGGLSSGMLLQRGSEVELHSLQL
mmetsp:Transcript_30549/g.79100  ORF Transcript_30549/g.79100 Transcript_30549/m.79100 type:complete len:271 (-) Transcript_30549:854-1666(-)